MFLLQHHPAGTAKPVYLPDKLCCYLTLLEKNSFRSNSMAGSDEFHCAVETEVFNEGAEFHLKMNSKNKIFIVLLSKAWLKHWVVGWAHQQVWTG